MAQNSHKKIKLATWKNAGRFFDYRGQAIFFQIGGNENGEALLLIHGFPTASWDWAALWDGLGQRYRLYTLDMIGFGFSSKPKNYIYFIADQANLFEHFLEQHGVKRYHVIAHNYGGTVAQELLARQSEPGERPAMRSLCFLNGGLFPETYRPTLTQKLFLSPIGPLIAKLISQGTLAKTISRLFGENNAPNKQSIKAYWALISYNDGLAVWPKLFTYITERRLQRMRWVGALQNSLIPLKLINGGADPISGRRMVARYRSLVPAPNITVLDGIGHYPQCEAPGEVLAAYLEFRRCSP